MEVAGDAPGWIARGKVVNRKRLPKGGAEGDPGRDTVIYSLCGIIGMVEGGRRCKL